MYASQYMVIPLPGILTYTKCMLANTWLIPLFGILTYTKCIVMPHTFICVYSYFPRLWYIKIGVIFFLFFLFQFSYKSLPKFPLKFRQSLPYTRRSQVIDIYPVYTFNILHLITQSWPNHLGSQSHKHHHHHHHHNHNIYNIHWTTNIIIGE